MKNHEVYDLVLRDKKKFPVIAYGTAGTGKTFQAVKAAYEGVKKKEYDSIVVVRPNVSFADKNGYLPGDEREKLDPWVRPVLQNLVQAGAKVTDIESMERNGKLQFHALEHVQGLTWDRSFVILDECQNCTLDQLKVFLTRTGKYTKVVLSGDVAQTSPKFKGSGLQELIDLCSRLDLDVHTINFKPEDIMRSEQCRMWIEAFERWERGDIPINVEYLNTLNEW